MTTKRFYLETFGCQMNVLDSELVRGQLRRLGYEPASDLRYADLILFNTCSVRQHAEDKVHARLGALRRIKRHRPDIIVGVIGCMAERVREELFARHPHVDVLCGPGELHLLPELLEEVAQTRRRAAALTTDRSRRMPAADRSTRPDGLEELDLSREPDPDSVLQAYVRIQRGCDKFCTFCVVPFTRGPERSRPPAHIVEEVRRLADRGTREITLLGQTVNSYAYREGGQLVRLPELLARVHDVAGIERIRFVTSYPGDFDLEILYAMRDLPKVCEYLHLPAQSGSDAVLRRMRRQYTIAQYLELVERARQIVPGIALAGDFIVGFCGETEEDFAKSVELVERVRYKNIFCFKYSPRPGTAADRNLPDDVPDEIKRRRNNELLAVQQRIALVDNQRLVGRTVEVLVEGYSKAAIRAQQAEQQRGQEVSWRKSNQLTGRTRQDQIVVFEGGPSLIGQIVQVRIQAATALTLHGTVVATEKAAAATVPKNGS